MQTMLQKIVTRKEFLKACGRYGMISIFALTIGLLAARRSIRKDRSLCSAVQSCRSCRQWEGCPYPKAAQERETIKNVGTTQTMQEISQDGNQ